MKNTLLKKHKHMEAKQYDTHQWMTEEIKEEIIRTPRDKWKWKHNDPKSMGHSFKSSFKREVYSDTVLPQETREFANKQPNLTRKATRKRKINKTQS